MIVNKASDHQVSGLSEQRYCSIQDVLMVLTRVAIDTEHKELGAWLGHEQRDEIIADLIPDARFWVNGKAGQDFDYHQNVAIAVDGSGLDTLDLSQSGFRPLLAISDLVISASAQDSANYKAYSDGRVHPVTAISSVKYTTGLSPAYFPRGAQNIEMTVSWGYTNPPEDIRRAQARRVAVEILGMVERADLEDGVVPGGAGTLRYGDLSIQMGAGGRYRRSIEKLEKDALEACLRHRLPKVGTASAVAVGSSRRSSGVMWD